LEEAEAITQVQRIPVASLASMAIMTEVISIYLLDCLSSGIEL